ncbi:MAG: type II secretion system protein N [Gammaproteobacteria bacterium]|nr:type II secretion system protein N [Gammaproteobacteria bacterium]
MDDVSKHKPSLWVWLHTAQLSSAKVRRDWHRMRPDERMTLASRHLPFWISLVLLVAIGYHLVRLVTALTPTPHQAWAPPTDVNGPAGSPSSSTADYVEIANAHLFGVVQASDEQPDPAVDAPPTTLSLELRGLVFSSDASFSHAIIADSSGSESVYFLQSEVPGGATLVAIQANRVILKRAGVLEALLLPRLADSGSNPSAGFAASTGIPASGELPAIPEEMVQPQAARLADIMMPRPHITGGQFQGVEVFPGERGEDFAGLGLKPGDVITAIDGRPLSASDAAAPFLGIAESATLTLTINRRGQSRTIQLTNGKLVAPPTAKT